MSGQGKHYDLAGDSVYAQGRRETKVGCSCCVFLFRSQGFRKENAYHICRCLSNVFVCLQGNSFNKHSTFLCACGFISDTRTARM